MYQLTATTDGVNFVYLHIKNKQTGAVSMAFNDSDATAFRSVKEAERLRGICELYMQLRNSSWTVHVLPEGV